MPPARARNKGVRSCNQEVSTQGPETRQRKGFPGRSEIRLGTASLHFVWSSVRTHVLGIRGLKPVGGKAGTGPQQLELETEKSLMRPVSVVKDLEGVTHQAEL